jgi:WD40 repeat protein
VAGGAPAESGAVEVYRWPSLELAYRCEPHTDVVYAVAWRVDSSRFAAASADTDVTEHDAATGKELPRLQGHSRPVLTACYLPDGEHLITAGIDETLRIWNRQGEIERTLSNHTAAVTQAALRPSSEPQGQPVIASAGEDRTVRIWQPAIGRLMRFVRLDHVPNAIAWSADGATIFAACSDGRVRTIDADTAELQSTRDAIDGVAYAISVAPDNSLAIGGSNGQVKRLANTSSTSPR